MTKTIGEKIRNFMVAILVGLLVVAFAVWGVNDVFTARAGDSIVTIGDFDISSQEFAEAFERQLQTQNRDNGTSITNAEAFASGLHNQVLQELVTNEIIEIDANDLGVGVNRRTARNVVKEITNFQNDLTGEFSEEKMESLLSQNRITRNQFEKDIYSTLRRQQTIPAIIGGISIPEIYSTQLYRYVTEQRKINFITISHDDIMDPKTPTETELKSYIDEFDYVYTAPEYRKITLLRLEPFDITPDMKVSEDEILAAFQYKIDLGELGAPEKRTVVQITALDENSAKKAADMLSSGQDPNSVASTLGLIQPEIYTNVVKDEILDPITAEESFKMKETESKSILGSLGNWYAISVSAISPAESPNYELQKEALRQTLLTEKAQEEIYDITGTIEDLMTDGLTLEEISDAINWPLSYYDYIDRSGSDQTGMKMNGFEAIPGIASDESILEETFIADLGFETDLFETRNGGYASVRVDEIIDSQRMPYEEVKYSATQAWKQSQKNNLLNSLATKIVKDINEGSTLKEAVLDLKNKSITEQIIVRGQPSQNLGNNIIADIFSSDAGAVVQGEAPKINTRQIAILEEVLSSEEFPTGEILKIIQERSSQEISNDLQNAYQQAILKDNTLSEYPEKIKVVLGITEE